MMLVNKVATTAAFNYALSESHPLSDDMKFMMDIYDE
jgi:hypothetical protein